MQRTMACAYGRLPVSMLLLGLGALVGGQQANLAVGKPSKQSSLYRGTGLDQGPQLGNDGQTGGADPGNCFMTGEDDPPWWMVDLEATYALREVRLYNRTLAEAGGRATRIMVLVSENGTEWTTVYTHDGSAWLDLKVPLGRTARYVKVQLPERGYLHLREVEVYGTSPEAPVPAAGNPKRSKYADRGHPEASTPQPAESASPVEAPGPRPAGLEPIRPEEPEPAAPRPDLLEPVAAGTRLAQATVGPEGGQVEAPGHLALAFPAGALAERETITVVTGPAVGGARLFDVTRTGDGVMAKPVQVVIRLPEEVTPAEVLPIHQIGDSVYHVPAFQYDPADRALRLEVDHFSAVGIVLTVAAVGVAYPTSSSGEQFIQRTGAIVGGAIVADALYVKGGLAAIFTVPGLGYVMVGAVAGAYLATKGVEAYYKMGLTGALPVGKFRFFWPQNLGGASAWLAVHRQSRMMLALRGPDDFTADQKAGQPLSFPGVNGTFMYTDIDFIRLPESILGVIADFQYADAWYTANQMAPPAGPTDVLIREMDNVGEVSLGMMHLRCSLLAGEAAKGYAMSAAVAHEMFHLICKANGWREQRFVGSEDSVCVAMESLVFPYTTAFSEFQWAGAFRRLRNGLTRPGPGEGDNSPAQRGYYLWPWTRYLAVRHGTPTLRDYTMGTVPDEVALAGRFRDFCYSIIATDREMADEVYPRMLDGRRVRSKTGWSLDGRTLDAAAAATMGSGTVRVPLGAYDLPPSCPLSFRVVPLEVPRAPQGALVVRRERPEPTEEFVALKPAPAAQRGPSLPSGHTTTRDMVAMTGGVFVRGPWVDGGSFKEVLPVAIICTATTPESAPQAGNRLLSYRLNPPSGIVMDKQPARPTRLSWAQPDLGCTLRPDECLSSYRVFGKDKNNRDDLIAELYFGISQSDLAALPGKLMLSLRADQTQIELPAAVTEKYVALGIQSVDGGLRYVDGRPVMSDIAWSELVYTVKITPNPFEVTVGRPMTFDAKADFPPPGARYVWSSTGKVLEHGGPSAPVRFDAEGAASVTVTLLDAAGKRLCSATADGRAKKKEEVVEKPEPEEGTPAPEASGTGVWVLQRIERVPVVRDVPPAGLLPEDHELVEREDRDNGWTCTWKHVDNAGKATLECDDLTYEPLPKVIRPGQTYVLRARQRVRLEGDHSTPRPYWLMDSTAVTFGYEWFQSDPGPTPAEAVRQIGGQPMDLEAMDEFADRSRPPEDPIKEEHTIQAEWAWDTTNYTLPSHKGGPGRTFRFHVWLLHHMQAGRLGTDHVHVYQWQPAAPTG